MHFSRDNTDGPTGKYNPFREGCAHLTSQHDNLRQLDRVRTDRVENILQLVHHRYESFHLRRTLFFTDRVCSLRFSCSGDDSGPFFKVVAERTTELTRNLTGPAADTRLVNSTSPRVKFSRSKCGKSAVNLSIRFFRVFLLSAFGTL